MKKIYLIIIIVLIVVIALAILPKNRKSKNADEDVKIPILLYHDFVTVVPDSDPDNFNYINTPQSFEENISIL